MWSTFNLLHVGISLDGQRCEFSSKISSSKCWLFSPIFVADTKIIFRYYFVAPLKKTLVFTFMQKNHIYSSPLSWNITKLLQTCYCGYFGHAWPRLALICRKLWYLFVNNKTTWSLNFFTDNVIKESCNLIGQEHFGQ